MKTSHEIKDQIIKNGFWGIISSILNRIGGFVLIIIISRLLMPEGFGKYSLAMAICFLFITFSDLGINQSLIRYVSLELDKNKNKARAYFNYFFKIRILLTLIASLILLLGAYPLSFYIFKEPQLFLIFILLSVYVLFTSLTGFLEALFFIKKNVKYISIKEFFSILFKLGLILFIGFFVAYELRLIGIFLSFLCVSILSSLFIFYMSKRKYPLLFKKTTFPIEKKSIHKFIFFLNLQNISLIILLNINIILLGIFSTSESVGYYNSALALVNGVMGLLFSFSYLFLPIFTRVSEEKFKELLKKVFRLFFTLALPISFGLCFLSPFFISHIYGELYLPASIPLSILAFIIPCLIGVDLALASLAAKDKQKNFAITIFIIVAVSFILSYILINLLSSSARTILIIMSIMTFISWLFCFISAIYFIKKELNINVISSYLAKIILSCCLMSLFIIFTTKIFQEINLFFGIIIILLSVIIYFISLFLMKGIRKEDFLFIKQIFKIKKTTIPSSMP